MSKIEDDPIMRKIQGDAERLEQNPEFQQAKDVLYQDLEKTGKFNPHLLAKALGAESP